MSEKKEEKTYLKQITEFYFAPFLRSFFTVFYLLFFGYFIIFYFDNIILAVKFVFYTLSGSTAILDLGHLFWGALFLICLIAPFSVSVYAILLPHEIWKKDDLDKTRKIMLAIFVLIVVIDIVIIMDGITRYIGHRSAIYPFLEKYNLTERL